MKRWKWRAIFSVWAQGFRELELLVLYVCINASPNNLSRSARTWICWLAIECVCLCVSTLHTSLPETIRPHVQTTSRSMISIDMSIQLSSFIYQEKGEMGKGGGLEGSRSHNNFSIKWLFTSYIQLPFPFFHLLPCYYYCNYCNYFCCCLWSKYPQDNWPNTFR